MTNVIMLAGDIHGNLQHAKYLLGPAKEHEVERIVPLGDFGYWEHERSGVYFLDWLEDAYKRTGILWDWLDGNHENHTLLRYRYMGQTPVRGATEELRQQDNKVSEQKGLWKPHQQEDGFWVIREGVNYIPRGHSWTWNGVKFAALGGAFSVDINWRKPMTSWWPEEMIEPDEVDKMRDIGKVDVFLSHDCPIEVDMIALFAAQHSVYFKADKNSTKNRTLLSKAVEHTHPDYLFHGHYHLDHRTDIELHDGHKVKVVGLHRDQTGPYSYTILYLKEDISDFKET